MADDAGRMAIKMSSTPLLMRAQMAGLLMHAHAAQRWCVWARARGASRVCCFLLSIEWHPPRLL